MLHSGKEKPGKFASFLALEDNCLNILVCVKMEVQPAQNITKPGFFVGKPMANGSTQMESEAGGVFG